MFTTAQTLITSFEKIPGMLLFVICLIVAAVWIIALEIRLRAGARPASLGWMTDQWLAEYRATHLN